MEFFRGIKIALYIEAVVVCIVIGAVLAYHSQTVVRFGP